MNSAFLSDSNARAKAIPWAVTLDWVFFIGGLRNAYLYVF
jgi:hypothetical protein